MQKITFEDLPSTNTPINASNLNALQTNVENAIPILNYHRRMMASTTNWTTTNQFIAFPFSTFVEGDSSLITWNNNNTFTLNKNVKKIRIRGQMQFQNKTGSECWLMADIFKNGGQIGKSITTTNNNAWNVLVVETMTTGSINDVFTIRIRKDTAGTISFDNLISTTYLDSGGCNLIIEVEE